MTLIISYPSNPAIVPAPIGSQPPSMIPIQELPDEQPKILDDYPPFLGSLNKEKVEMILDKAPKRAQTTLADFNNFLKKNTSDFNEVETAWLAFRWMSCNIEYDIGGYLSNKKVDTSAEGTFKSGKTVCSGYTKLCSSISNSLGIEIVAITGYVKGFGCNPETHYTKTNHEWNAVKLNNSWYLMDPTWGAGGVLNNKFNKSYHDCYFCSRPEYLIRCHFPIDPKWQLDRKSVV